MNYLCTFIPPVLLVSKLFATTANSIFSSQTCFIILLITGVSGDKIEIDPVSQPKTTAAKFWSSKQKAVSIDTDRLAACALTDEKPSGELLHWKMFDVWFLVFKRLEINLICTVVRRRSNCQVYRSFLFVFPWSCSKFS